MNLKRAEQIIWEELDGGALLVHAATGARWTLSAASVALWKLCEGRSTAQLAQALRSSREDVVQRCTELMQLGLLVPAGASINAPLARLSSAPGVKPLGLGSGPRRRPSPTGSSGPA